MKNAKEAGLVGFGTTFQEFELKLREIRKARYAVSLGELNAGNVGIAAPIFRASRTSCGSLTAVLSAEIYEKADRETLVRAIAEAAKRISVDVIQKLDTNDR